MDSDAVDQARPVLEGFAAAMSRRDLEAVVALFVPGPQTVLVGTGPDEWRVGGDELRAHFARDFEQAQWLQLSWHESGASYAGDALTAWSVGEIAAGVDGERFSNGVRFTATLVRLADSWCIAQAHLSFPAVGQKEGQSWPTAIERLLREVASEAPDLRGQAAPDGTVTLLFTDIENSSEAMERLGDIRWLDVLRRHTAIVVETAATHGGFVVKSLGDGFMLAFQSARRGVACALDLQQSLAPVDGEAGVRVRFGLHTGEVLKEGDDFFGLHVTLAARVGALAEGGQVLVSGLLRDLVESTGEFSFANERMVQLRGLTGLHRVYEATRRTD